MSVRRLRTLLLGLGAVLISAASAAAHPHVWVTVKTTVQYDASGAPSGIRHRWTFDEMFSSFASQGLDTSGDGALSREELAELAEVNVTSMAEFGFFTTATAGATELTLGSPVDYFLEHADGRLTLNFTLPLSGAPKTADGPLKLEIYDPAYFVAFDLDRAADAASLAGAPADCRVEAKRPQPLDAAPGGQKLTEQFFSSLDASSGFGERFAHTILVRCGAEAVAATGAREAGADRGTLTVDDLSAGLDQANESADAGPRGDAARPGAGPQLASASLGAFGVVRPDGALAAQSGFLGWIALQQSNFYRAMSGALTAAKRDGSALGLLAALGFAYGVFHAAGPGHGKAVIASYLVATGDTLRRGVAISFAAAAAQALTAIGIVAIAAGIFGATSRGMGVAAYWLEALSYAAIAGLGAVLLIRKGQGLLRSLGSKAAHGQSGGCGPGCGHAHAPDPNALSGPFDWRRAAAAIAAVGLRPCTGALLILAFALAQGMLWAGVAATFAMALGTAITVALIATLAVGAKHLALRLASGASNGYGVVALRGVETLAGLVVLAFGLALLGGLLASGTPPAG